MENGMMLQGFSWYLPADGAHWKRLAELAPTLAHMGVSSVWMPPAYKSSEGAEGVGYAVYDPWDLGEFDQCGSVRTKYGTRREYLSVIRALQKAGIQVLADVVLNQRFGGEECEDVLATPINPANRNEQAGEPRQISAWTRYRFPGRADKFSDFHWDWRCFHGTDWDESTHEPGVYLFDGKHWDEDVDKSENGNYDYLMGSDVDVSEPAVEEELGRWGEWYLKTTGVDGFRLDALKHISRAFFHRWLTRLREATGKELFTVGEYWSPEVEDLESYLGEVPMSLFDVPLHYRLFDASNSMGERDLAHVFDDTLVQREPIRAVTFVDNHDTQPNQALQSTVQDWFKPSAYMLILLREAGVSLRLLRGPLRHTQRRQHPRRGRAPAAYGAAPALCLRSPERLPGRRQSHWLDPRGRRRAPHERRGRGAHRRRGRDQAHVRGRTACWGDLLLRGGLRGEGRRHRRRGLWRVFLRRGLRLRVRAQGGRELARARPRAALDRPNRAQGAGTALRVLSHKRQRRAAPYALEEGQVGERSLGHSVATGGHPARDNARPSPLRTRMRMRAAIEPLPHTCLRTRAAIPHALTHVAYAQHAKAHIGLGVSAFGGRSPCARPRARSKWRAQRRARCGCACATACGMAWKMLTECVPACLRRRAAPASSPGPHAALGSRPSPCDKH